MIRKLSRIIILVLVCIILAAAAPAKKETKVTPTPTPKVENGVKKRTTGKLVIIIILKALAGK